MGVTFGFTSFFFLFFLIEAVDIAALVKFLDEA